MVRDVLFGGDFVKGEDRVFSKRNDVTENNILSLDESKIISITRVTAMVLIVLCHYVRWYSHISWIGQFFNVGVGIFFLISGFLHGQKKIQSVLEINKNTATALYLLCFSIYNIICIWKVR